jgi:hypothetical protein
MRGGWCRRQRGWIWSDFCFEGQGVVKDKALPGDVFQGSLKCHLIESSLASICLEVGSRTYFAMYST